MTKPILFNTEMVKAILEGRKTQTRRPIKPQPEGDLHYGIQDDIIRVYHSSEVDNYARDNTGEWHCIDANTGSAERRLCGGIRREHLLTDEICGIWEKGIRGLVSPKGTRVEETPGLCINNNESFRKESNQECPQADMLCIPRGTDKKEYASATFGRELPEQQTGESSMGDSSRKLAGSEDSWNCERRGKTLECENNRCGQRSYQMGYPNGDMQPTPIGESNGITQRFNICNSPFRVGTNLYVRETWREVGATNPAHNNNFGYDQEAEWPIYKASHSDYIPGNDKWRPSIHMPKEYARLFLEVVDVRAERVQSISEADAQDEGSGCYTLYQPFGKSEDEQIHLGTKEQYRNGYPLYKHGFATNWDAIYRNWADNPWVWVNTFKVIPKPEQEG